MNQAMPLPQHFEKASEVVREEDLNRSVICGPDQEGFFDFFEKELQPRSQREYT